MDYINVDRRAVLMDHANVITHFPCMDEFRQVPYENLFSKSNHKSKVWMKYSINFNIKCFDCKY